MPIKCWCGQKLQSENRGVISLSQCPNNCRNEPHRLEIKLPEQISAEAEAELEKIYAMFLPGRNSIPISILRDNRVREITLSATTLCLENGCGKTKFLCSNDSGLLWLGSCGHFHYASRRG